jgi:hypothetical protein
LVQETQVGKNALCLLNKRLIKGLPKFKGRKNIHKTSCGIAMTMMPKALKYGMKVFRHLDPKASTK